MFNMFNPARLWKIRGLNIKLYSIYQVFKDTKLLEKYSNFLNCTGPS